MTDFAVQWAAVQESSTHGVSQVAQWNKKSLLTLILTELSNIFDHATFQDFQDFQNAEPSKSNLFPTLEQNGEIWYAKANLFISPEKLKKSLFWKT